MLVREPVVAGSAESSDIMVMLEPGDEGIEIELDSPVERQFGGEIRGLITDTLRELGVESARVRAVDKGALHCVIRARVQSAVYRACAGNAGGERPS